MEQEFHQWLKQRLPDSQRLILPVGDDAAIFRLDTSDCVVATDTISDEVDFDLRTTDPRRIGHKALGVNLSDLAAMAAQPVGCVVALLLPADNADNLAREIIEGMIPLAEEYNCPIAGGDVHIWKHPLAITVTVIGQVANPQVQASGSSPVAVQRNGAQPGDLIVVTGAFGGSILGRHLNVQPRVHEMQALCQLVDVNAAIDCSDGLALDLHRLANASDLGAEIDAQKIPLHADAKRLSESSGDSSLQHALQNGEDFELIFTVPAAAESKLPSAIEVRRGGKGDLTPLSVIGRMTSEPGIWIVHQDRRTRLAPKGYVHGT